MKSIRYPFHVALGQFVHEWFTNGGAAGAVPAVRPAARIAALATVAVTTAARRARPRPAMTASYCRPHPARRHAWFGGSASPAPACIGWPWRYI